MGSEKRRLRFLPETFGVAETISLVNGSDRYSESREKFILCENCEGGARYEGIALWLMSIPTPESWTPFSVQFNANEEQGMAVVHIDDNLSRY